MIKNYKRTLFSAIILSVLPFFSFGQIITNSASIQINSGAVFTVNGDLNNKGKIKIAESSSSPIDINGSLINSKDIINDGEIYVAGDWLNTADYTGKGLVLLDGTETQELNNNGKTFEYFYINKKENEVELTGDVRVNKELSLDDGRVNTNDSKFTLSDTATVAGGSFDSYISGSLYQEGVTGEKYYPLGTNNLYTPLEMSGIKGSEDLIIKIGSKSLVNEKDTIKVGLNLIKVDSNAIWKAERIKGTYQEAYYHLNHKKRQAFLGEAEDFQLVVAEASAEKGYYSSLKSLNEEFGIEEGAIAKSLDLKDTTLVYLALGIRDRIDEFFIPTAFSPYSKEIEDQKIKVYSPDIDSEKRFTFAVFDQWENLVFESTDYYQMVEDTEHRGDGWNGISEDSGNILAGGVYNLIFKATLINGKRVNYKSTITLIK